MRDPRILGSWRRRIFEWIAIAIGAFALGHDWGLMTLSQDMFRGRLVERSKGLIMQIDARRYLLLRRHHDD